MASAGSPDLSKREDMWRKTKVEKGWLDPPMPAEALRWDECVPRRRFPTV